MSYYNNEEEDNYNNENTAGRDISFRFANREYDITIYELDLDQVVRFLYDIHNVFIARIPIAEEDPQSKYVVTFSYWHNITHEVEHVDFTENMLETVDVLDMITNHWKDKTRNMDGNNQNTPSEMVLYKIKTTMGGRRKKNYGKKRTIKKRKQNCKKTQSKKRNNKK